MEASDGEGEDEVLPPSKVKGDNTFVHLLYTVRHLLARLLLKEGRQRKRPYVGQFYRY